MNIIYKKLFRPILFKLDAELAHNYACRFMSIIENSNLSRKILNLISTTNSYDTSLFGLTFRNKIGLAAGMDKNGKFPKTFSAFGFGHVEIGTVTPKAQIGNPKPRLFRYPKYNAIVNRMGFNNEGAEKIINRIERIYPKGNRAAPLGINLGKGKETSIEDAQDDYIKCLQICYKQADYATINISSPNTPNLRDLHDSTLVYPLLKKLNAENLKCASQNNTVPIPLLLKISPDENFKTIEYLIECAVNSGFGGVIATNTSIERNNNGNLANLEKGGMSGKPIQKKSTEVIKFIAKLTNYKFPIVGVGGIQDVDSALKKFDAGASLIQLYTSLVYEGPFVAKTINKSLLYRKVNWV